MNISVIKNSKNLYNNLKYIGKKEKQLTGKKWMRLRIGSNVWRQFQFGISIFVAKIWHTQLDHSDWTLDNNKKQQNLDTSCVYHHLFISYMLTEAPNLKRATQGPLVGGVRQRKIKIFYKCHRLCLTMFGHMITELLLWSWIRSTSRVQLGPGVKGAMKGPLAGEPTSPPPLPPLSNKLNQPPPPIRLRTEPGEREWWKDPRSGARHARLGIPRLGGGERNKPGSN